MHRSPGDAVAARQLFEDAIRRDPQFALAYDALADLYWWLGFTGLMAPRDAWSKGLLDALRAVEIDSTLAETHAMVAQYRLRLEFDWAEVDREMRCALQLTPESPVVRLRYATSGLMPHGRLDEAVAELERALELDPLSSWTRMWLVTLLWLGFALAYGGNEAEARQLLGRFHAMAAHAYVPPTNFAWVHLGLGEIDEAFACMDKAIDARDGMMTPIKSHWFLDPIRDDPRFAALLRKLNLTAKQEEPRVTVP